MGHPLVNPTKGKLGLAAPTDAKGIRLLPASDRTLEAIQNLACS